MQPLFVPVDDNDVVPFAGKAVCDLIADLPGPDNDDFHCVGSPIFVMESIPMDDSVASS